MPSGHSTQAMKLPPSADKWVVLCAGLLFGLLEFSLLLPPLPWLLAASMQAMAFVLVYAIRSLCWRLLARRAGQRISRHVRIWPNTTFVQTHAKQMKPRGYPAGLAIRPTGPAGKSAPQRQAETPSS